MDDERFDELSRALVPSGSRRGILRSIAAGALGSVLAWTGVGRSAAAPSLQAMPTAGGNSGGRSGRGGRGGGKDRDECTRNEQCKSKNECEIGTCVRRGGRAVCTFRNAPNGTICGGRNQIYPDVCRGGRCVGDDGGHSNGVAL